MKACAVFTMFLQILSYSSLVLQICSTYMSSKEKGKDSAL